MACVYIFSILFFPVFKCSVSCGIGIQVRKIDCILPAILNASHSQIADGNRNNGIVHHHHHSSSSSSTSIGSASIGAGDGASAITSLSDEQNSNSFSDNVDESMLSNEPISMDCDPKLKPIETQTCTTGIECTTTTSSTTPIDFITTNNSHEDNDKITNTSNENGMENETENINSKNDNERSEPDPNAFEMSVEENNNEESIEVDDTETNGDGGGGSAENSAAAIESDEIDENEVLFYSLIDSRVFS